MYRGWREDSELGTVYSIEQQAGKDGGGLGSVDAPQGQPHRVDVKSRTA